jgi:fatty-acyl-CoA synthase
MMFEASLVVDAVATHARARPHSLACIDLEGGRRWTYAELDADIDATAAWLVDELGPASGERVATLARNGVILLVLQLGCVRAGAIYTPFNWRLAGDEVAALIEDAKPALLLHGAEFPVADMLQDASAAGSRLRLLCLTLVEQQRAVTQTRRRPPPAARRGSEDASTLLYTSGTSGKPKGVPITETNAFWGSINFILGNQVTSRSVFLCDMPMFHTAGLFAAIRSPLLAGAAVLISRGFDPAKTLARLADRALGITHYFSVPQMAQSLWQQPGFEPEMLRSLTVYAMGGAPNPAPQVERFVRAGIAMSDGFGMSETCSNFGMPFQDPELLIAKAGSCGLPYISTQARIVQDGRDVGDGEPGELWLRGPSIFSGYWQKPGLTAECFADGWFKTGDTARRDGDGFYFLIDRKKDMYISGGENIYPAEVEAVIAELEFIAEVAVIGVADARWGEVGRAYIRLVHGHHADPETVLSHCRSRLARFKAPATVVFTDQIPRTSSGKVQKQILKARARAELDAKETCR